MKPIRLVSGFLTVGSWTLLSRLLGFVRDISIAGFLGAGPVAEAFLVAFALPNMFRRFFAEGAMNMAFVPLFAKRYESGEAAEDFAQEAFSGLFAVLTLFSVIGIVAMPALVWAMASGFAADERFALATFYGRIAFPYILLISLAALLSGILNATGRFVAAAAAPALLNIVFVAAMLIGHLTAQGSAPDDGLTGAYAERMGLILAFAVPVGGIAQLALVWLAARRAGFTLLPRRPRWSPQMRRLVIIALPAMLAGGVVQINLLVGRQVASFFDGAVAWLSYADRLYQLPLGTVGIAIGIVLLPDLSRRLRAKDEAGSREALSRAAELSLALTIPAAVALMVIAAPLVSVLFERGAFDAADSRATALAVAVYGAGLPAFVLQKVLQPLFFAREDTRRPFHYALVAMAVNAVVAIGLAPFIGFIAAALGTTLAGWAMVWLLWRGGRDMGAAARFDARFIARLPRIVGAALVMGAVLWLAAWGLRAILVAPDWRYLALLLLVIGGGAAYFAAGGALGAFRLAEWRRALRRRP